MLTSMNRAAPARSTSLTIRQAVDLARLDWSSEGDPRSPQSVERMGEIAERFARRLASLGIVHIAEVHAGHCESFIEAPSRTGSAPSNSTSRMRRSTLRALFRSLRRCGHDVGDPTLDLELDPRGPDATRPLTTVEVEHCRTCAEAAGSKDLRRSAAWALAEAGALTSEIAQVTIADLDDLTAPTTASLAGTKRLEARTVELTIWGRARLAARLAEMGERGPDSSIVYGGRKPTSSVAAQASACNLISRVLDAARLSADDGVRPSSVRLWRARSLFCETGRIEDAARLLGHWSLDEAAAAVGYDWRAA